MNKRLEATGGCLCGVNRFKIFGVPHLAEYCHCKSCRKSSGAPVMAWVGMALADFKITQGTPECYVSSAGVKRTFCKVCGTSLTQFSTGFQGEIYVSISILDDQTSISPDTHIWRSDRLPWFETTDNFPRYSHFKSDGILEKLDQ
jgi:hypothetical protein